MGRKSIHPVSVLRSVDKTSKSVTLATAAAKAAAGMAITTPNGVDNPELVRIRVELNNLFTGCTPLDHKAIHEYLSNPSESDRMMLDAWARCGRNDRQRTVSLRLTEVARKTVTPMGLACLVRYARAWIDEAEARAGAVTAAEGSSGRAQGGASRYRKPDPSRRPRALANAKRTK